jgi:D-serine dehydratase
LKDAGIMNIQTILETQLNPSYKGIPSDTGPVAIGEVLHQGWNILREDLSLPLLLLKQSALDDNRRWMQSFLRTSGLQLAPHGKTPMAPQLFQLQLADGAWGLTCATGDQLRIYRQFGVSRILMANQLVGRKHIQFVLDELKRDPAFDFYCLVDSTEGVQLLDLAIQQQGLARPLQVLVECGVAGKRTGCRDLQSARDVMQAVVATEGRWALRGVEGYEGVIQGDTPEAIVDAQDAFYDRVLQVLEEGRREGWFGEGELILSLGYTGTLDRVWQLKSEIDPADPVTVVVRSGCYLTMDSVAYQNAYAAMCQRTPAMKDIRPAPRAALELWGYVASRPEPGLAIIQFGRRDCPYDKGLPVPECWHRPGANEPPAAFPADCSFAGLYDQHAVLLIPPDHPLTVGDLVGAGVSHPCAAFEKWQWVPIVDEEYNVVDAIRTYF